MKTCLILKVDLVNKEFRRNFRHNGKIQKFQLLPFGNKAGVRYSIENPSAYVQSNLVGFCNIIEVQKNNVDHFYASSSSVYGEIKSYLLKNLIMLINL